jgi:hypothetical protein
VQHNTKHFQQLSPSSGYSTQHERDMEFRATFCAAQYNNHTVENAATSPSIKEIEKRLRKLRCTKEQVRRHVDQLAMSRTVPTKERRRKSRPKRFDS